MLIVVHHTAPILSECHFICILKIVTSELRPVFVALEKKGDKQHCFYVVHVMLSDVQTHRCGSMQIFGGAKNFCSNVSKLARKAIQRKFPPKTSSRSLSVTFFTINAHTARPNVLTFFPGFSPNSKRLGMRLHHLHPRLLHQCRDYV